MKLTDLKTSALAPWRAFCWSYVPLLTVYFCFGASAFTGIAETFWIKEVVQLSAVQLATIATWVALPWTLKILVGQFLDSCHLFGSRRQSYLWLGAGLTASGFALLAALAGNYSWITGFDPFAVILTAGLLQVVGFMIQDVVADTMSTEVVPRTEIFRGKSRDRKTTAVQADLAMVQVLGRLALIFAGVATAYFGGWLAAHWSMESIFWLALVLPALTVTSSLLIPRAAVVDQISPVTKLHLGWLLLGGGLVMIPLGLQFFSGAWDQELTIVFTAGILGYLLWRIIRNLPLGQQKVLWGVILALFVFRATPGVGAGLRWWVIDELGIDAQWLGVLAQVGAITSFLVLWLLAKNIATQPVRTVLFALIITGGLLSLPELLIYYGWHETVGWSPRWVLFFDSALGNPLVHISMIPVLATIAFYAPVNHRGMWFALASSAMNLALAVGSLGTKYLNQLWPVTAGSPAESIAGDYQYLGVLMISSLLIGFILPMLAIFFLLKPESISPPPRSDSHE